MLLRELYSKGVNFKSFLDQDQDVNREKAWEIYHNIELENDLIEQINGISSKTYIIGFAEIWCPDCIINVPAIQKLVELNPNFELKILPREGNEISMEPYKFGGKIRIPTFVILGDDFNEKGAFIERPSIFNDIIQNGNELQRIIAKRKYKKGDYVANTIEQVVKIVSQNTNEV